MGRLTVFKLVAMNVVFGLIFTTSDQGSDIILMVRTYFYGGGTLGSVACKHCFADGKLASQISEPKKCQLCTEERAGLKDGGLQCGANALFMEKFPYFQETCDIDKWVVMPETNIDGSGASYCNKDNICCITSQNIINYSVKSNNAFQDDLLLAEQYRYTEKCKISLIIGHGTSKSSCNKQFRSSGLSQTLNSQCNGESYHFNDSSFTIGDCDATNSCCILTSSIKQADCSAKCEMHLRTNATKYFECCKLVRDHFPAESKFRRCGRNACQLHLDYLKYSTTTIYNEASWRNNFVTIRGVSMGGALCTYLKNLSILMFIPILVHWILVSRVWLDDYRKGKTSRLSFVFALLNCYSQVRLAHKLIKYYTNEKRLQSELEEHDLRVTCLEPIFEAIFQVSFITFYTYLNI